MIPGRGCGKLLMLALLETRCAEIVAAFLRWSCPLPQTVADDGDAAGALVTWFRAQCGTDCALTFVFFATSNSDGKSLSLSLSLVAVCAPSSPSYRASCVWFIQHGANINSATNHLSKEELAAEDLFSANFLQFSHQHAPDSAATVKRGFTLARSFSILTH